MTEVMQTCRRAGSSALARISAGDHMAYQAQIRARVEAAVTD
jgi:hypothetical protein